MTIHNNSKSNPSFKNNLLFPAHTKTRAQAEGNLPSGANKFDADRVGNGPNRTVSDALETAKNNAMSYVESALSMIVVPLMGLVQFASSPWSDAPAAQATVGIGRLVLGAPANGLQALADGSQMAMALADAGVKALQNRRPS